MPKDYEYTDLLDLIKTADHDTISAYLGDVMVSDFKGDIEALIKKCADKEPIKEAILLLQGFI